MVFVDNPHEVIAEAIFRRVVTKQSILITQQPSAIRAGPQTSMARNGQAKNAVFLNLGGISAVENYEAHAVESHKSAGRPNPQIAVGRLRECLGHVLGQAVLRLPHPPRIAIWQSAT